MALEKSEEYRRKARILAKLAKADEDPLVRRAYAILASAWMKLAENEDIQRNGRAD